MGEKVSAYGFDSYNQCWQEEIMPTIRSHGGGDESPKCLVRISDELPKDNRPTDGK